MKNKFFLLFLNIFHNLPKLFFLLQITLFYHFLASFVNFFHQNFYFLNFSDFLDFYFVSFFLDFVSFFLDFAFYHLDSANFDYFLQIFQNFLDFVSHHYLINFKSFVFLIVVALFLLFLLDFVLIHLTYFL